MKMVVGPGIDPLSPCDGVHCRMRRGRFWRRWRRGPAPIANAGQDEAAPVGTAVTLDGSASEAPSGLLTVVRSLDLDPIPCDRIVLIPTVRPFGHNALEV